MYVKVPVSELAQDDKFLSNSIDKIDAEAVRLREHPIDYTPPTTDFLAGMKPLPQFLFPDDLPVIVSLKIGGVRRSDVTPTESTDGAMVGFDNTWIQNVSLKTKARIPALGISYNCQFLHVWASTNHDVYTQWGADGVPIGKPGGGDWFALRSVTINLTGANRSLYSVVYKIEYQSDLGFNRFHEGKDGDLLAADGREFTDSIGPSGNIEPVGFITKLSVQIHKRKTE
jgi:hypothetical protein